MIEVQALHCIKHLMPRVLYMMHEFVRLLRHQHIKCDTNSNSYIQITNLFIYYKIVRRSNKYLFLGIIS